MKRTVCICVAFIALAFGLYAQTKPAWVSDLGHSDLYGYVSSSYGSSDEWAYEVGVSYKATTEKRARIRAEQDLAARIGAVLGTTIVGNTDFTGISEFIESYGEEMLVRYEEAVNLAVKVKIPNIEHLEYYTEKGVQNGTAYYIVSVLGRYKRTELKAVLEKIDFEKTIMTATKRFEQKEAISVPETLEAFVLNVVNERSSAIIRGEADE